MICCFNFHQIYINFLRIFFRNFNHFFFQRFWIRENNNFVDISERYLFKCEISGNKAVKSYLLNLIYWIDIFRTNIILIINDILIDNLQKWVFINWIKNNADISIIKYNLYKYTLFQVFNLSLWKSLKNDVWLSLK